MVLIFKCLSESIVCHLWFTHTQQHCLLQTLMGGDEFDSSDGRTGRSESVSTASIELTPVTGSESKHNEFAKNKGDRETGVKFSPEN